MPTVKLLTKMRTVLLSTDSSKPLSIWTVYITPPSSQCKLLAKTDSLPQHINAAAGVAYGTVHDCLYVYIYRSK